MTVFTVPIVGITKKCEGNSNKTAYWRRGGWNRTFAYEFNCVESGLVRSHENCQVQYSTSLGGGIRMNLGPVIPGQGTAYALALPATPSDPVRFYRLMMTAAD